MKTHLKFDHSNKTKLRQIRIFCSATMVAGLLSSQTLPAQTMPADSGKSNVIVSSFKPVPLPDPKIPGYTYPVAADTITAWTKSPKGQIEIQKHAWGIWTALTLNSGETYQGQPLRVFETWETPDDIMTASSQALMNKPRVPNVLTPFHQLNHAGLLKTMQGKETVLGFVKYDPIAAAHIRANNLFSIAALNKMLAANETSIPAFPAPSLSLKPVFQTLKSKSLVQARYFQLSVWPGPPKTPVPFPSSDWKTCVWIDTQDTGTEKLSGGVDNKCAADGSSRTAANTYGLKNFIHFKVDAANAELLNKSTENFKGIAAGDYSVLVAMHVGSREITEWTWQSFWWTPAPDLPPAPSSAAIAKLRPAALQGAPRHYAHCAAYQTLSPPQPETGGKNVGESVYCYNPYLEAGFGPSDLPDSIPGKYKGQTVANNVGVQTNCMSCHAAANFNPKNLTTAPNYSGDRYLGLNDPRFKGTLQVDFLWSIPGNAK